MRYTGQQILNIVIDALNQAIANSTWGFDGTIYRRGYRPANSETKDCVVAFLGGDNGEDVIQEGYVVINIYVPDLQATDGYHYENTTACLEAEQQLKNIDDLLTDRTNLRFRHDDIVSTIEEPAIHQHFVSAKLYFKDKYREL